MTELQGWLIVCAVWVSACGVGFRAYTAWRAFKIECARVAWDVAVESAKQARFMTIRLDPESPSGRVRES